MADQANDPTPALEKLHLDEVTGEKISKSELKKRAKQRATEERKAASGKNTQPAAQKQDNQANKNAEADESNLTPNVSVAFILLSLYLFVLCIWSCVSIDVLNGVFLILPAAIL